MTNRIAEIHAAIAAIRESGDVLQGWRLELASPGGTAGKPSQQNAKYGRLRRGRGKGQQSIYVPLAELAATAIAVERGREITRLQRELVKLQRLDSRE